MIPRNVKRMIAVCMAFFILNGAPSDYIIKAHAAEIIGDGVRATYDEAYYVTTDYYGNLTEGGVVKSYMLNGAKFITDYGDYDSIENLTDGMEPDRDGDACTFRFGLNPPARFYFEGKTAKPFRDLPWSLSVHYMLNGVPSKAEDLAGKTGVVELDIDAIPNPNASEYAKNNYILAMTAIFNQDDILSLEAPGAQTQLLGNLRTVLFLAFPSEEQHFQIRIGAEDFSFNGLTFMIVPATLSQLDDIAELSEKKTDLEDSYHKLSDSLDTVLDSFHDMQNNLYHTADGLDELDAARDIISKGKDGIYGDLDVLRRDLDALSEALKPVSDEAQSASAFVKELQSVFNNLTDTSLKLGGNLTELEGVLYNLQENLKALENSLSAIESGLADMSAKLLDLETGLRDTEAGLIQVEESLSQTADGLNNIEINLRDAEENLLDLEDDLDNTQNNLDNLDDNLSDTEDGLSQVEDGLRRMENALGGLDIDLDNLEENLKSLEKNGREVRNLIDMAVKTRISLNRLESTLRNVPSMGEYEPSGALDFKSTLEKVDLFDKAYLSEEFPEFLAYMLIISGKADSAEKAAAMAGQLAPLAAVPELPEDNENYANWIAVQKQYMLFQAKAGMNFENFVAQILSQNDEYKGQESKLASQMDYLNNLRKSENAPALDILIDSMDDLIGDVNHVTNRADNTIQGLAAPTASVIRDLAALCKELDNLNPMLDSTEDLIKTLRESSEDLRDVLKPTQDTLGNLRNTSGDLRNMLDNLSDLTGNLQDLTGDLRNASGNVRDISGSVRDTSGDLRNMLDNLSDTSGALRNTLEALANLSESLRNTLNNIINASANLRDLSATARDGAGKIISLSDTVQRILSDIDQLRGVLNRYEPVLQSGLNTLADISESAEAAVWNANKLITSAESLMKSAGRQLDTGTKDTLSGLSDTLRTAATGLDSTQDLRDAKDAVTDLIEDTWDEHSGDMDNLLNMDSGAEVQSLTSNRNPAPKSIQILIRTQEIEKPDNNDNNNTGAGNGENANENQDDKPATFLGRVGKMFRDLWHMISGVFRK